MMPEMTEKSLLARDAKRDIGAELLQSVKDMKAGQWARKTTIEIQNDGSVRRRVTMANGKVTKDEVLTRTRWALLSARTRSGLSQADFAQTIGVSKRTLENWEQGRVQPSGPARILLNLVTNDPVTVKRLSKILPNQQLTA